MGLVVGELLDKEEKSAVVLSPAIRSIGGSHIPKDVECSGTSFKTVK